MVKGRRFISQRLMRTTGIIPIDPLADRAPGFLKTAEIVLPNTFFLQTPKEAFYENNLFKEYKMQQVLDKLDLIECFEKPGVKLRVGGGILSKQCQLYLDLGVDPPSPHSETML